MSKRSLAHHSSLLLLCLTMPCAAVGDSAFDAAHPVSPAIPGSSLQKTNRPPAPADGTPAVVVDDNSVESLLGKNIVSATGDKLGQITDILVSHSGEIRAAVIDFGGFLGVGSRKVAVAWSTLRFSTAGVTLTMTRDELRVTPEYREGEPIVIVGPQAAQSSSNAPAAAPPKP